MDNKYLFMENVDVLKKKNNTIMENTVLFREILVMENSAGFPAQP
jgi:hypothetical protein